MGTPYKRINEAYANIDREAQEDIIRKTYKFVRSLSRETRDEPKLLDSITKFNIDKYFDDFRDDVQRVIDGYIQGSQSLEFQNAVLHYNLLANYVQNFVKLDRLSQKEKADLQEKLDSVKQTLYQAVDIATKLKSPYTKQMMAIYDNIDRYYYVPVKLTKELEKEYSDKIKEFEDKKNMPEPALYRFGIDTFEQIYDRGERGEPSIYDELSAEDKRDVNRMLDKFKSLHSQYRQFAKPNILDEMTDIYESITRLAYSGSVKGAEARAVGRVELVKEEFQKAIDRGKLSKEQAEQLIEAGVTMDDLNRLNRGEITKEEFKQLVESRKEFVEMAPVEIEEGEELVKGRSPFDIEMEKRLPEEIRKLEESANKPELVKDELEKLVREWRVTNKQSTGSIKKSVVAELRKQAEANIDKQILAQAKSIVRDQIQAEIESGDLELGVEKEELTPTEEARLQSKIVKKEQKSARDIKYKRKQIRVLNDKIRKLEGVLEQQVLEETSIGAPVYPAGEAPSDITTREIEDIREQIRQLEADVTGSGRIRKMKGKGGLPLRRGRPKKTISPAVEKKIIEENRRSGGRKKKPELVFDVTCVEKVAPAVISAKKGRGRPKKAPAPVPAVAPIKRARGRPKKIVASVVEKVKRGRGRPMKKKI